MDAALLAKAAHNLRNELDLVANVIRDKGHQRFQRAFLIAAIVVFGAYHFMYVPSRKKLADVERRIEAARLIAQNADVYKALRDQIAESYALLPSPDKKDHFLTQAMIETLKSEGITSESIQPPVDRSEAQLVFQDTSVTAEVRFAEIVSWLARLEAVKPYLQVTDLNVSKSGRPGYCTLNAQVSTMIPAQGGP